MKKIWRRIIKKTAFPEEELPSGKEISNYRMAKAYRRLRYVILNTTRDVFLMILGITSAAFGLESFLLPAGFIDGGVIGIALLGTEVTGISFSWLILILSTPFIILGFNSVGKQFAIKAALSILGLALVLANFHFPEVTTDKLLVAVFGGGFIGAGTGLSMRGGSVIDGTEVLAIYLGKKLGASIGDIVIIINVIIFSVAAMVFSVEAALYSIITYFTASKTITFLIEGIEEYTAVNIISVHSDEIREMIIHKMRRGVTIYKGKRGVKQSDLDDDIDIVYTVITRLELNELNTEVKKIDPNAFVVMSSVKDTKGGMIKRRPLH